MDPTPDLNESANLEPVSVDVGSCPDTAPDLVAAINVDPVPDADPSPVSAP